METRMTEGALDMLDRAARRLGNLAKNSEEHRFAREAEIAASHARAELRELHLSEFFKLPSGDDWRVPDECYCNANNAPCTVCQSETQKVPALKKRRGR